MSQQQLLAPRPHAHAVEEHASSTKKLRGTLQGVHSCPVPILPPERQRTRRLSQRHMLASEAETSCCTSARTPKSFSAAPSSEPTCSTATLV